MSLLEYGSPYQKLAMIAVLLGSIFVIYNVQPFIHSLENLLEITSHIILIFGYLILIHVDRRDSVCNFFSKLNLFLLIFPQIKWNTFFMQFVFFFRFYCLACCQNLSLQPTCAKKRQRLMTLILKNIRCKCLTKNKSLI